MLSPRQTNKEPILAKNVWLNTYEVECSACHELRWPTLAEKPSRYTCVRCRAEGPAGKSRREAGRKGGQATSRARIERKGGKDA